MDVGIVISIVISLAVLVWMIEFPSKQINDLKKSCSESMNVLYDALKIGEINREKYDFYTNKLLERSINIDKDIKRVNWIKRFLPILLAIEVLHITLQFFPWYWRFEQSCSGLNNWFLIFIGLLILFYFIIKEIKVSDNKILAYKQDCMSSISEGK